MDYPLLKKLPKLHFTSLIEVNISKTCSDHLNEIEHIYKITLIMIDDSTYRNLCCWNLLESFHGNGYGSTKMEEIVIRPEEAF